MNEDFRDKKHISVGRRTWLFRLLLVSSTLVIMALVGESASRSYERHRRVAPDAFPSLYYPHKRMRHGLIPNSDYFGWLRTNSRGFRGREFSLDKKNGIYRIACLGGSTTLDIGSVGDESPWTSVLEEELRQWSGKDVEVINCGVGGFTSLDSLINLQINVLSYDPDLIIFYHAHNDFVYSLGSGSTKTDLYPLEQVPRGRCNRWLSNNSILFAKGTLKIKHLFHCLRTKRTSEGKAKIRTDDERIAGSEDFRRNLNSFLAICKTNDIDVVLPEVVIEFREGLDDDARDSSARRLSRTFGMTPERILAAYQEYNQIINELAVEHQAMYIVTSDFVPGGPDFFHDAVHFNGQGSTAMGKGLGMRIGEAFLANDVDDASASLLRHR